MGWIGRRSLLCALPVAALLAGLPASGQGVPVASAGQPQTVVDVLHQLSDKADVIFVGQVVAIRRSDSGVSGAGVVEIEFRVDQAVRGCSVETPYVLREWAGLWVADSRRYRVGRRMLMLLHAQSAAGMSSPVGGLDGAIPIRQGGAGMSQGDVSAAAQPPFVDLRWLGVKVPRVVSYGRESARPANAAALPVPFLGQEPAMQAVVSGSTAAAASTTLPASGASATEGSVPAQQASVDAVIGMLTSWQREQHDAP